jgi:hypothetical protein
MVSANTKTKSMTKQGCNGSQDAQTIAVIKLLYVLTTQTGACNQLVELAKDWRNDCLEKQKSAHRKTLWSYGKAALNGRINTIKQ